MNLESALAFVDNPLLDISGIDWTTLNALAENDYAPAPGSSERRDPNFDERIQVNYLRHRGSPYDAVVSALRQHSQPASVVHRLRENMFETIARQFPHLAGECERQLNRRAESTAYRRAAEQSLSSLSRIREEVTQNRTLSYEAGVAQLPPDAVVKYLYELHDASFVMAVGEGGGDAFCNWMNGRNAPRKIGALRAALLAALDSQRFQGPVLFEHHAERVRR